MILAHFLLLFAACFICVWILTTFCVWLGFLPGVTVRECIFFWRKSKVKNRPGHNYKNCDCKEDSCTHGGKITDVKVGPMLPEGKMKSNQKWWPEQAERVTIPPRPPAPKPSSPRPSPEKSENWIKEWSDKKRQARVDSNWKTIADVDWEDLEHFVARTRQTKDSADFDTCVKILGALRKQILTK